MNVKLDNGVLILVIYCFEVKNVLYGEFYLWIVKVLDEVDLDNSVCVVILCGEDVDFIVGNDM